MSILRFIVAEHSKILVKAGGEGGGGANEYILYYGVASKPGGGARAPQPPPGSAPMLRLSEILTIYCMCKFTIS